MLKHLLTFFAGLSFLVTASAADMTPDALVRTVSTDVLEIVRADKEIQSGSLAKAVSLSEAKVLPHFNFAHMTRLAMGKDWRKATPEQQKVLIDEFRMLLVRTYSKAFIEYRNQTIDYKPFKMQPTETDVLVRTAVSQATGKPVQIDYNLEKGDDGWKVYDIAVAGVSLVTNYRSTFTQEVSAGGVEGVIAWLKAKNKSGETAAATK